MKKLLAVLTTVLAVSFSTVASASLITNADISNLDISAPDQWTWENSSVLFDGATANNTGNSTRFVGRMNGGDSLSANDPFIISIDLVSAQTVIGLSIFNDYGTSTQHSVDVLGVDLFSGSTVTSLDFANLAPSSFGETILASGLMLAGVDRIEFSIMALNGTNFEIRELSVEVADAVQASAPSIALLSMLVIGGMVVARRK